MNAIIPKTHIVNIPGRIIDDIKNIPGDNRGVVCQKRN